MGKGKEKVKEESTTKPGITRQRVEEDGRPDVAPEADDISTLAATELLSSLTGDTEDYVLLLDGDLNIVFVNRVELGLTREELIGKPLYIFASEKDQPSVKKVLEQVLISGTSEKYETEYQRPSGDVVYFESVAAPTRQSSAGIRLIVTTRNITERKQADEALFESVEKYRTIFESVATSIIFTDKHGYILDISPYHVEKIGLGKTKKSDYMGMNLTEHPSIISAGLSDDYRAAIQGKPFHKERVFFPKMSGGTSGYYNVTATPLIKNDEVFGAVMLHEDVTEIVKAEEELLREQAFIDAVIRSLPGLFYVFEMDRFRFMMRNDTWEALTGYTDAELDEMNALDFFAPGEDRDLCAARMQEVDKKGFSIMENNLILKGGEKKPYFFTGARLRMRGETFLVGIGIDVSDRHEAEEERRTLEAQVQHSQKLESLGVLAGGIAHDFNNILLTILGNVGLALDDLSELSPVRTYLEEVSVGAKRASDLTRQMLAYSGKGDFVRKWIDLSELVGEMSHLMAASVSKNAVIQSHMEPDLPPIDADISQVQQIVMNLITNASEAIDANDCPEGQTGSIKISTGVRDCDHVYLARSKLPKPPPEGKYVFVEVEDSGCGMDDDTLSKIFEPFFTTKFTGRGLGMAAVLGIVRGHGGAIVVDSEPGKGTRFTVLFPACEGVVAPQDKLKQPPAAFQGRGTILVVDDEPQVLQLAKKMIDRMGFDVLVARDGVECVEVFRKHQEEIVCVVLDLTMPKMDGKDAHKELTKINENVVTLISSGYNEESICDHFGDTQPAGFLKKPFMMNQLQEKIRDLLGIE